MLIVLLSWVIIIFIFLTFGDMFIYGWNKIVKKDDRYSFFDSFWIGICSVSAIATIISLFAPLNIYVLGSIISISIFFLYIGRKRTIERTKDLIKQFGSQPRWVKNAFYISFLFILIYSIATPLLYDLGLYHLQTMMWIDQYSVVPGLGSVHGRLAFNSSFLLLSTLFNYHTEIPLHFFSINGLCMLIFTWWIIIQMSRSKSFAHIIVFGLLYILLGLEFFTSLSSTSTDILVNILVVYLIINWLTEPEKIKSKILLYGIIPIFCITLKLSSGVILLFSLLTIIYVIKDKEYKSLGAIIGLGAVIVIPWCTRFVILSGYLIYPLPAIDLLSFDWKMPINMLIEEKDSAYAWARMPFHSISIQEVLNMSYFDVWKSWFGFFPHRVFFTYTAGLISPIFILPIVRQFVRSRYCATAWIIAYAGTIFGFMTAPCLRFTIGFIVCSICIPLIIYADIIKNHLEEKIKNQLQKVVSYSFVLLLFSFIILSIRYLYFFRENENIPMHTYIIRPQSVDYAKKELNISFIEHAVNDITIYSPKNEVRCFDQCLPCTPYFNNNIEMRGSTLQDGFRIKRNIQNE